MTTVGVDTFKPWRVDALRFPSYNYHYPAFKQRQLCEYYECYKSRPSPNFRRVDAERMWQMCECFKNENTAAAGTTKRERDARRLFEELAPGMELSDQDLIFPPAIPAPPKPDLMVRPRLGKKEYDRWRYETTPVVTTQARAEWSDFLNRYPDRFDIKLPMLVPGNGDEPYYDGSYALRFLRPHLTRGIGMDRWRNKPLEVIQSPVDDSPYRPIRFTQKLIGQ